MKTKSLLASLLLALNFNLFSQEFTKAPIQQFNKQYSVKATTWLENKLDLPRSPYQITIKTLGKKSNKRFSARVNLNTSYSDGVSSNLNLNLRFGKERFLDFGKEQKWRLFYGLDYLLKGRTGLTTNRKVGSIGLGIAPFAGLQYRINERIVVYTETNYEVSVSGIVSNARNFQATLNNKFIPMGSIWLGFELFKSKKG
ncbi:MAG: hypothetical protein ACI85O_001666 [Saprospiraceae bacterium]|jgi:hypothetical protein